MIFTFQQEQYLIHSNKQNKKIEQLNHEIEKVKKKTVYFINHYK